ncbi:MAG TPA: hypothetical protein VHX90_07395, partial [Verrucomicrobiae bacterium]|nr:hypothetical protein [Verrucomicrobiae bacterium]
MKIGRKRYARKRPASKRIAQSNAGISSAKLEKFRAKVAKSAKGENPFVFLRGLRATLKELEKLCRLLRRLEILICPHGLAD